MDWESHEYLRQQSVLINTGKISYNRFLSKKCTIENSVFTDSDILSLHRCCTSGVCVCKSILSNMLSGFLWVGGVQYLCWSTPPPACFCTALCSSCWISYTPPGTGRYLQTSLHHTHTSHSHNSHGLKGNMKESMYIKVCHYLCFILLYNTTSVSIRKKCWWALTSNYDNRIIVILTCSTILTGLENLSIFCPRAQTFPWFLDDCSPSITDSI